VGMKRAVVVTFIIVLLLIGLGILLEVFTGMGLKMSSKELTGERLEGFSVLSVKLVRVRDAPKSYACRMEVVEIDVWYPEERVYKRHRRTRYEDWDFVVYPFDNHLSARAAMLDVLNWTVAEVDGEEMLIVTVPAHHTLEYRRAVTGNFTVSRDLWFRADIRFLSNPPLSTPILIEPPRILAEFPAPCLFYIVTTDPTVIPQNSLYTITLRDYVLLAISLWKHSRCTVTATLENFFPISANFDEYVGCRIGNEMYIRIPERWLTEPRWPRRDYTVALSADLFEPDVILEVEVRNEREYKIMSFMVDVGSDVIDVKPRDFIERGESYVFKVAPRGNFRVGGTYNVTVTALFEDYKTLSVTRQATCESS